MSIRTFHLTFRQRASEWMLAGIMFTMGWVLLQPYDMFANPSYAGLAQIAPQLHWGLLCAALGGFRLIALWINGSWRATPHLRSILAFVSSVFWFQLVLGIIASPALSTNVAIFPWLLATDIYCAFRAAVDARVSDES